MSAASPITASEGVVRAKVVVMTALLGQGEQCSSGISRMCHASYTVRDVRDGLGEAPRMRIPPLSCRIQREAKRLEQTDEAADHLFGCGAGGVLVARCHGFQHACRAVVLHGAPRLVRVDQAQKW